MKHASCRVAAVQPDSAGTPADAQKNAIGLVGQAIRNGAELVCLPEHWIPGPPLPNIREASRAFADLAKETGTFIVPGADFSRRGETVTVESPVFGPAGLLGRQAKTHLFRREKRLAVPGDVLRTFDLAGVKVGIAVCHDLVYPEVARVLTLKGAELILAPAMISPDGYGPWQLYVKTRALENRVHIVSPNAVRPPRYRGGSVIVGFEVRPEDGIVNVSVLKRAGSRPGFFLADLDLRTIRRYREQRMNDRRPELYAEISRNH